MRRHSEVARRSIGMVIRTITIESPQGNTLSVQIDADLVDRFVGTVTTKGGLWRSKRKKETFQSALESAVAVALTKFLDGLEVPSEEKAMPSKHRTQ